MNTRTLVIYLHQPMFRGRNTDKPTETTSSHSTQAENQGVDRGSFHEEPTETLPKVYTMQAAAEYAIDLVAGRALREESETMSKGKHRGAWREDYEMRVFGGPSE